MKNKRVTLFIVLFLSACAYLNAQVYEFPITPASEKWKEFKTHDEMVAACEIPELVLKKMSTEDLVATCMNYPLFGDFIFYDNYYNGINYVIQNSNLLEELTKRKDAFKYMLSTYKNYDISARSSFSQTKLYFIELLFSNENITNTASTQERQDLFKAIDEKFTLKENAPDKFGLRSIRVTAFLAARNLEIDKRNSSTKKKASLSSFEAIGKAEIQTIRKQIKDIANR